MKDIKLKMELETTTFSREFYGIDLSSRYSFKITRTLKDGSEMIDRIYADYTDDLGYLRRNTDFNRACFAKFRDAVKAWNHDYMRYGPGIASFRYHINCDPSGSAIRHFCNYCWMNKEQLTAHIDTIKTMLPDGWSYKFIDTENYSDSYGSGCYFIEFKFDLSILSVRQILFLLTWVRHCCEFSGNYSLYDAYLLKKAAIEDKAPVVFKEYPEMELFHITDLAYFGYFKFDQSLGGYNVFPVKDGLQRLAEKLKDNNTSLCSLYDDRRLYYTNDHEGLSKIIHKEEGLIKKFSSDKMTTISWLMDEEVFMKERLPIHLKNWEMLNQLKKEYEEQQ